MKQGQATCPVSVALAGALLAEARPGDVANQVEEAGGGGSGGCGKVSMGVLLRLTGGRSSG